MKLYATRLRLDCYMLRRFARRADDVFFFPYDSFQVDKHLKLEPRRLKKFKMVIEVADETNFKRRTAYYPVSHLL